jgi:hypothetical protein
MKEVTDELFDKILSESQSQYFFHRDDTGKIELVFETGVMRIEPGDTDLADREWNPKLTDADGNPRLDRQGNVMQPWTTFQAKVKIISARDPTNIGPKVYSFGGERSPQLREFIKVLKVEELSNKTLPGTKWTLEKVGQWDWSIQYLGKEEVETSSTPSSKPKEEDDGIDYTKVQTALSTKKDQGGIEGIPKNDMIVFLSFVLNKKSEEVKVIIPKLVSKKLIKEENDKYYIL